MSDTPHHLNQEPADFAAAVELLRLSREEINRFRQVIQKNNAKVKDGCEEWACSWNRDTEGPCPNCPMEYWIEI